MPARILTDHNMHWTSPKSGLGMPGSPKDGTRRSTWGNIIFTAQNLADVGWFLLQLRGGKVRPIEVAAIGVKALHAGMQIYDLWTPESQANLNEFFEHPGSEWKLCPSFVTHVAFEGMEICARMDDKHQITRSRKIVSAVWTAMIDGVLIGWVGPPEQGTVPNPIYSPTPDKLRDVAARRLWEEAGPDKIVRVQGYRCTPHYMPKVVVETDFLHAIEWRVSKFVDAGSPRAFIMNGEPGAGKTTTAGYLARKKGYKTVVMNAIAFVTHENSSMPSGAELAEIMRPDVLVLNDIDKLNSNLQLILLDLLDNAKSYAKVIFATTNNYRNLIEAASRPGRLDDLLHVPGLTLDEIKHVGPDLGPIAKQMVGWPLIYVADMQERFKVLGPMAYTELPQLAERLANARKDARFSMGASTTAGEHAILTLLQAQRDNEAPDPYEGANEEPFLVDVSDLSMPGDGGGNGAWPPSPANGTL